MVKPTTVYLDERLLQAAKIKAVQARTSVSRLLNEALKLSLKEDAEDLKAISGRRREPSRLFEDVLKSLKQDGLL